MNYKATIKKLHEEFPDFDIETIIKILDCYVNNDISVIPNVTPNVIPNNPSIYPSTKPWENIIYCRDNCGTNTFNL